jgi:hypothetical protein
VLVPQIALTANPLGGTAITIGVDIDTPSITTCCGVPETGITGVPGVTAFKALASDIVIAMGFAEVFKKPQ